MASLHTRLVKLPTSVISLRLLQRQMQRGKSTLMLTQGPSSSYLDVTSMTYIKRGIFSVCIVKYVNFKMTFHNAT